MADYSPKESLNAAEIKSLLTALRKVNFLSVFL